jgi:hypothetical protein
MGLALHDPMAMSCYMFLCCVEQISSYARDTWNLFIPLLNKLHKKVKYKLERKELCNKFKEKAENNPKNVVGRPTSTECQWLC